MNDVPRTPLATEADKELISSLAAAIRTAAYFDAENAVMVEVGSALARLVVKRTEREGSLRVGSHSHCVFVDGARIRTSLATFERFSSLMQVFVDREISALTFRREVSEVEVVRLAIILARETARGPEELNALLQRNGVTHIEADSLLTGGTGQALVPVQAVAPVQAYVAAVELGEKLREATMSAKHVDVRQVRHVTQAIVDRIMDSPRALVALTTVKEMDESLVTHSSNVAILSVLLGQRLGLSKPRLGELCLAGFLHDAGKLEVGSSVLGKAGPLDENEWTVVRRHPLLAARGLLTGQGLTPATMRAVVVAYEHHLNYDMSGYPQPDIRSHVSLYGNIVTIADRYDALTTARAYRGFSFSPHEVVGYLLYYSGNFFDPMLVKLFVGLMGLFPPGTLLRLSDGTTALVCDAPAEGKPLDRPKVRMWTGARTGEVIDLGDGEGLTLDIAMVLSPAGMGQVPAMETNLLEVDTTARSAGLVSPATAGPPPAIL